MKHLHLILGPLQLGEFRNTSGLSILTMIRQKPTLVSMAVRNDGVVPVDWVFNFPNDLQVHLEGWADPGEYTEDQVHQNLILDNSLFSVTPKSGTLSPNQTAHVLLSYTHEFAGLHKLPVVFKLKNGSSRTGKEVKINFVGYSVIASKRVLQIPASVHYMEPIAMGVAEAPIQMQRIINRGTVPLEYSLDTSVLDQHKEENYDFEIFKCRKTKGVIPPNGVEFLEWIFRPLAAKNYEVLKIFAVSCHHSN